MVIRTRSVEYMPFLLSLFNFINGLVWTGYAFVGGVDIFIAVSLQVAHNNIFQSLLLLCKAVTSCFASCNNYRIVERY